MIKRFLTLLLTITLLTPIANAHDFEVDGIYYEIYNNYIPPRAGVSYQGTSSAEYSNEYSGDVVIPETVTYGGVTYTVKSIVDEAFAGCTGLTSITIPNSITYIGSDAFSGCTGLTRVNISDLAAWCNISYNIEWNYYCQPLTYAHHLYLNGSEVKDLIIPSTVTKIRSAAFYYCTGLTSVTIPNSVTSIGEYAFANCTGLKRIDSYPEPNKVGMMGGPFYNVPKNGTLHVLPQYLEAYQTTYPWNEFTNIVGDLKDEVAVTGDVDGSAMVDVDDVNAMINLILNFDQYKDKYPGSADLDGNGMVDVDDVNALINIILN